MIKSILVCTDGSQAGNTACEYGIYLALQLKAELAALHVLDSRMLEGPMLADISGWLGAQPFTAQLQQFQQLMDQKGQAVIGAFQGLCKERGIDATGKVETGHPAQVILGEQSGAELLIMGAYAHSRMREYIFGGATAHVLAHANVPVLMSH